MAASLVWLCSRTFRLMGYSLNRSVTYSRFIDYPSVSTYLPVKQNCLPGSWLTAHSTTYRTPPLAPLSHVRVWDSGSSSWARHDQDSLQRPLRFMRFCGRICISLRRRLSLSPSELGPHFSRSDKSSLRTRTPVSWAALYPSWRPTASSAYQQLEKLLFL